MLSWNAPASVISEEGISVGYYRRFIEGFLKITNPMTVLLGKDQKFK
jgi:hypothetical protein